MPDQLVTISVLLKGLTREEGRKIAKEVRDGVLLNLLSELEQRGMSADDVDGVFTFFAPTLSFPLPVKTESDDAE